MARIALTASLIILVNILVGCDAFQKYDSGKSQLVPAPAEAAVSTAQISSEVDIVEQVVTNRLAYRQSLDMLVGYYTRTGNNMKLKWAAKELAALNTMPQYKYITEAEVAGPDLKVSTAIPEADAIYRDAANLEKQAGRAIIIKDKDMLEFANMLAVAGLIIRAASIREESRGTHLRSDFPDKDDKKWKKHIILKKDKVSFKKVD